MASRPVFQLSNTAPFVCELDVDFQFYPGFSVQQKQRSVQSLHESFLEMKPGSKILEVSSKSTSDLGVKLSAFNLTIEHPGFGEYTVESAFQSSKVFQHGGPFRELLGASSREAKRDSRLRDSGALVRFQFFSREFPLEPKTYFYDWLYASALWRKPELLTEVVAYDSFTDIEYNPKKSINCQARSVAKIVGLWKQDLLESALETPVDFLAIGYGAELETSSKYFESLSCSVQDKLF